MRLLRPFILSEKLFRLCASRKAAKLLIIGIVLRRIRGAQNDEFLPFLFDKLRQIFAPGG